MKFRRLDRQEEACVRSRMVSTVSRIRTSLAIGAAIGTVIAALLMSPRGAAPKSKIEKISDEDGMSLGARLVTSRILEGQQEQNLAVTITAPNPATDATIGRPPLSLAIVIDPLGIDARTADRERQGGGALGGPPARQPRC